MFKKILRKIIEDDSLDMERKLRYIEQASSIEDTELLDYLMSSTNGTVADDAIPEGYVPINDKLAEYYGYRTPYPIYDAISKDAVRSIERDRKYVNQEDLDAYFDNSEDEDSSEEEYVPVNQELANRCGLKSRWGIYKLAKTGDIRSIRTDRLYVHEEDLFNHFNHEDLR